MSPPCNRFTTIVLIVTQDNKLHNTQGSSKFDEFCFFLVHFWCQSPPGNCRKKAIAERSFDKKREVTC